MDTALLAVEFQVDPEQPPGANGFLKLLNWLAWGVLLACFAAIVYSGGKFAWERHQSGAAEAPKMLIAALIGAVVSGSAGIILNAVTSG